MEYIVMKTFSPQEWDPALSKDNVQKDEAKTVTSPIYNKGVTDKVELAEQVEYVIKQIEMQQIDITPDYPDWLKVGFALCDAFGKAGESYFIRLSNPHKRCKQSEAKKKYAKCMEAKEHGVTIATFFYFAKKAGIDIVPPKKEIAQVEPKVEVVEASSQSNVTSNSPCEEIQSDESGSLDFRISGSGTETTENPLPVVVASPEDNTVDKEEIQKSKNPEIQSHVVGSKWILDEDELPRFPQSVYDSLPPFLHEVMTNSVADDDRDMLLIGTLACLSATLHNVSGKYDKDYWYPMLYFFVMAEAGMGKGALTYCRQLVAPINKDLREVSEQQIREYNEAKRMAKQEGGSEPGDEPKRRTLFIPTNSSASAFVEQLDNNDGIGLLFDTECDTLSSVLKSDFGDYSSYLRKGYHHEPIELSRRKDNEFRSIEHPMIAMCLSGTPEQLHSLTPDTENGLFSRILYYHIPFKVEFRDTLMEDGDDATDLSLRDKFYQLGVKYQRMRDAFFRGGEYRVRIPQYLCSEFNAHYRILNQETVDEVSHAMQGVTRRLAFAMFRVMMILTAVRFMDEHPNPSSFVHNGKPIILTCSDEDFRTAMAIGDTLIYHAAYCYAHLPKTVSAIGVGGKILSKADKMNILYDALPDSFDKPQYAEISKQQGYSKSTTSKWINDFITQGRIERCGQNAYRKAASGMGEGGK